MQVRKKRKVLDILKSRNTSLTGSKMKWPPVGQGRMCKNATPSWCTLSQRAMPLLFVAISSVPVGGKGGTGRVTRGVILMGPVMRVDRLMHGGGWALARCCLQIGFLRVRHPRWAISTPCAATFLENDLLLSKWSAAGPTVNPSTLSWCALGYHAMLPHPFLIFFFFFCTYFP